MIGLCSYHQFVVNGISLAFYRVQMAKMQHTALYVRRGKMPILRPIVGDGIVVYPITITFSHYHHNGLVLPYVYADVDGLIA
jgi:hypothetical protein